MSDRKWSFSSISSQGLKIKRAIRKVSTSSERETKLQRQESIDERGKRDAAKLKKRVDAYSKGWDKQGNPVKRSEIEKKSWEEHEEEMKFEHELQRARLEVFEGDGYEEGQERRSSTTHSEGRKAS